MIEFEARMALSSRLISSLETNQRRFVLSRRRLEERRAETDERRPSACVTSISGPAGGSAERLEGDSGEEV